MSILTGFDCTIHTRFLLHSLQYYHLHHYYHYYYHYYNHNYDKILKFDWLSTALISALIGQYASCLTNWTVWPSGTNMNSIFSLLAKKSWNFLCFD